MSYHFGFTSNRIHTGLHFSMLKRLRIFYVDYLVHDDGMDFFIPLKFHPYAIMQLLEIAQLKFLLKLRFEPLELGYIASQLSLGTPSEGA
jgi:hypothetical protein